MTVLMRWKRLRSLRKQRRQRQLRLVDLVLLKQTSLQRIQMSTKMVIIAMMIKVTKMMSIRLKEMMLKTKMWLILHAMTISTTVQTSWQTALAMVNHYSSATTWQELVSAPKTTKSTVGTAAIYLSIVHSVKPVSNHLSYLLYCLPSIPDQNDVCNETQ